MSQVVSNYTSLAAYSLANPTFQINLLMKNPTFVEIFNASPYFININPGDGNQYSLAPGEQDLYSLTNFTPDLQGEIVAALNLNGAPPSNMVVTTAFNSTTRPPGTYPAFSNDFVGIGNTIVQASTVVNTGNAAATAVISATPFGAGGPQLLWYNDGSGVFGGGLVTVDNVGQFTWKFPGSGVLTMFTWDNTSFPGGHKLYQRISSANEYILQDLTVPINLLYLQGTVTGVTFQVGTHFALSALGDLSLINSINSDGGNFSTNGAGVATITATDVLRTGNQEMGKCGCGQNNAIAANESFMTNFKTMMTNVPSSITLTTLTNVNFTSFAVDHVDKLGFRAHGVVTAGGATVAELTYTTVGN